MTRPTQRETRPRPTAGPRRVAGPWRSQLWRVAVADGSMLPAIAPGDWLLVDPTPSRWPRRGSVVVVREPGSDVLAIKRVAARPGDWIPFAGGWLRMGDDEAWLVGDASDDELATRGLGVAIDSRRYGPVALERLAGRAWFRYAPVRRIGRIARGPADLARRAAGGGPPSSDAAGAGSAAERDPPSIG